MVEALAIATHLGPGTMPQLTQALLSWMGEAAVPPETAFAVQFAVEELVTNQRTHAGGEGQPLHLQLELQPDALKLTLEDPGLPFDPSQTADPNLAQPLAQRPLGGLGIYLTRHLASRIHYTPLHPGNRVCCWFSLHPPPRSDAAAPAG